MNERLTNFYFEPNQDMSHQEIARLLHNEVASEGEFVWISDVFDSFFVYEVEDFNGEATLFRRDYSINEESIQVSDLGERSPVRRRIQYVDANRKVTTPVLTDESSTWDKITCKAKAVATAVAQNLFKENRMNEQIDVLVNEHGFDRNAFEGWTVDQVKHLYQTVTNQVDDGEPDGGQPEPQTQPAPNPAPVTSLPQGLQQFNDFIERIGVDKFVQGFEASIGLAASQAQTREQRINTLAANERCSFTAEELKTMSNAMLDKMERQVAKGHANYAGQGFTPTPFYNEESEDEVAVSTLAVNGGVVVRGGDK